MKILFIAPTPFFADRGTHIRILEEALALEKRGHEITIATYHIGREISSEIRTKIDIRRIRRLLFWYKKLEAGPDWQKIVLDLMLIRKAFNLARTKHQDIIHGHLHEGVLIGWIVKKLLFWRKMKLVADFHGSLTKEMVTHSYLRGGFLKKLFEYVEKRIDNMGDYAITSSWENTDEIRTFRKNNNITTILDGVNLDYYRNIPAKSEMKNILKLPKDKLIVTYTGALVMNKGIRYLLEAIPKIIEKNKNVFFMIGGFPMHEAYVFMKQNNLENNMRLISPLNYFNLPKLLAASDVAIDPKDSSTRQASGKILQYMAAGLPVVCFDRANNREYLDQGAYFSQKQSSEGIAEGIEYFINRSSEIMEKGDLNRKKSEQFSWDKSAEKIEEIYNKVKS